MKTNFNSSLFLMIALFVSISLKSQTKRAYYSIETLLNNENSVVYAGNIGNINLNNNTNELSFTANLADVKTGNKKMDSLMLVQENIPFTFQANLGQGLLGYVNEAGDNTYHKVDGNIIINNVAYPTVAYVKIENVFKNLKTISKTLVDIKLQFTPTKLNIPYLSSYFNNSLLLKIKNGVVYQNI